MKEVYARLLRVLVKTASHVRKNCFLAEPVRSINNTGQKDHSSGDEIEGWSGEYNCSCLFGGGGGGGGGGWVADGV